MKKTLLFLFCLLSVSVNAQLLGSIDLDPKAFPTNETSATIVNKALNGSMVVVKQSYQVKSKKNGKVYGRDGRKEFGEGYTIGVKTDAGLVLTDEALKPWADDNAYKKIENNYEPFISLTEVREIRNNEKTKFVLCPLQLGQQQPKGLWIANTAGIAPNAMEIDTEEGKKDGWLIWFMTKENIGKDPTVEVVSRVINKDIDVNGADIDVEAPSDGKAVLGGVYVCPHYLGGGHVSYQLVGVVVKEGKQWKLRTPFVGYAYKKATSVDTTMQEGNSEDDEIKEQQPEEENVELTPIAQDKQEKKKNKK